MELKCLAKVAPFWYVFDPSRVRGSLEFQDFGKISENIVSKIEFPEVEERFWPKIDQLKFCEMEVFSEMFSDFFQKRFHKISE